MPLRTRLIAVSKGQDTKSSRRDLTPDIDNNSIGIEPSAYTPSFPQTPGQGSFPVACASILTHPNPAIASAGHTLIDLDSEPVSTGPKKLRLPENVFFDTFIEHMVIPTLVYELEHPRTDRCATHFFFESNLWSYGGTNPMLDLTCRCVLN